jgi:hypothetical protein
MDDYHGLPCMDYHGLPEQHGLPTMTFLKYLTMLKSIARQTKGVMSNTLTP